MSAETIAQIVAVVGSAMGATWILSNRIASLESALQVHAEKFKSISDRVAVLEKNGVSL